MANTSIFAAFERMWQHVVALVGGKADSEHNHNDTYDIIGTATTEIFAHNTDTNAHSDIRTSLTNKVNTSDVISVTHGGTGRTTIADTEYTTAKYRASALVSTETNPTENGTINWTYK